MRDSGIMIHCVIFGYRLKNMRGSGEQSLTLLCAFLTKTKILMGTKSAFVMIQVDNQFLSNPSIVMIGFKNALMRTIPTLKIRMVSQVITM